MTQLVFPKLTITLAEISAQSWFDWYKDFVINGNNGPSNEKGGALTFLAPDLKTELAHINFFNLSILKIAPDVTQTNNRRVTAELSCGRMEFVYKV